MSYGRGGAGNIQEANAAISADLEANQQSADEYLDPSHGLSSTEQPSYAHLGRGGAGNYYSPKELVEKGNFHGANSSHVLGDGTPTPSESQKAGPVGASSTDSLGTTKEWKDTSPHGADSFASGNFGQTGAYRGRGGAGNYALSQADAKRQQEQENEKEKERLKKEIEKSVQDVLARPEKAKTAGGERW